MEKLEMVGKIESLKDIKVKGKGAKREGVIVVKNDDGTVVTWKDGFDILEGRSDGEEVTVTMTRSNKTLKEALKTPKKKVVKKK